MKINSIIIDDEEFVVARLSGGCSDCELNRIGMYDNGFGCPLCGECFIKKHTDE